MGSGDARKIGVFDIRAYSCVRRKDGNRVVSGRLSDRQSATRAQKLSVFPLFEQWGIETNRSHFVDAEHVRLGG
jgi:hypothetical protein